LKALSELLPTKSIVLPPNKDKDGVSEAEMYRRLDNVQALKMKYQAKFTGFSAEQIQVDVFHYWQSKVSKDCYARFEPLFSGSWNVGPSRFETYGQPVKWVAGYGAVKHELDSIWSIYGQGDERLVICQSRESPHLFYPLRHFPASDHGGAYKDFLLRAKVVWWVLKHPQTTESLLQWF